MRLLLVCLLFLAACASGPPPRPAARDFWKELGAAERPGESSRVFKIRALEAGGESAAAELVAKLGSQAKTALELAYRLDSLCERKRAHRRSVLLQRAGPKLAGDHAPRARRHTIPSRTSGSVRREGGLIHAD